MFEPQPACYRHPERQTGIRCQRCERPVCPECAVPAPVGVQCPDCVRAARSRVITAAQVARASRPYVTYALVGLNTAVWAGGLLLGLGAGSAAGLFGGVGPLAALGGLVGPRVAAGEWWRLFTAGFLHAGLLHLGMNMVALVAFGLPLERVLGRVRFGALYLASLLAGSFGALIVSPGALTVGASGAIFGLIGALIVGQRAAGVSIWRSGLLPLLVINLVFTVAVPGISLGGHVGGLLGGLAAGYALFRLRLGAHRALFSTAACLAMAGVWVAGALWAAASPLLTVARQ